MANLRSSNFTSLCRNVTLRSHGRQQYTGLQTEQEGWTYYMEESTGTRSTGTVDTNSTEMSDSSTRGSPMQTGSPPPACLDHTYYSIQVRRKKLSFHQTILEKCSDF